MNRWEYFVFRMEEVRNLLRYGIHRAAWRSFVDGMTNNRRNEFSTQFPPWGKL